MSEEIKQQEEPNNIVKAEDIKEFSIFRSLVAFELAQRMAKLLASSDLVPKEFKNNISNTVIALELANRTGSSPFAVMQNIYIVNGKPGWSSTFIIAALNNSGRFSPLRFDMQGEEGSMNRSCAVWAYDKANEEKLIGPRVTMKMAQDEGWLTKNGSKWKTMPEVMLRYRAATFFGRLYAPDVLAGMKPTEEREDIEAGEDFTQEIKDNANREVIDIETGEVTEPSAKEPEKKPEPELVGAGNGGNGGSFEEGPGF